MEAKKLFLKIISLAVSLIFTFTSTIYGVPHTPLETQKENAAQVSVDAGARSIEPVTFIDPASLTVPENFGTVTERFRSAGTENSKKLIIQIQDSHCNYEAQSNICKLIETLSLDKETSQALKLIAVEGAQGIVDPSFVRSFPDKKIRQEASDYFVRIGWLTGTEFYAINSKKEPLPLWGIEERPLYDENLDAFKKTKTGMEKEKAFVEDLSKAVNLLKLSVFSRDLLALDKKREDFDKHDITFTQYCTYLAVIASEAKQSQRGTRFQNEIASSPAASRNDRLFKDPAAYPHFTLMIGSLEIEKKIDTKKIDPERKDLINELQKKMVKEELSELVRQSLFLRTGKITSEMFYAYLKDAAAAKKIDMAKYANVAGYMEMVFRSSRVNAAALSEEVFRLEKEVKDRLYANNDEKELDETIEQVQVLNNLVQLRMTRRDLSYYREHKNEMAPETLVTKVKEIAKRSRRSDAIPGSPGWQMSVAGLDFSPCTNFYDAAIKRDKVLVERTIEEMERRKSPAAAFVTGGFHTQGTKELFKAKGYSYVVVTPRMTEKYDDKIYLSRMLNEGSDFDKLFSNTGNRLAAWSLLDAYKLKESFFAYALAKLSKDLTRLKEAKAKWVEEYSRVVKNPKDLQLLKSLDVTFDQINKAYILTVQGKEVGAPFALSEKGGAEPVVATMEVVSQPALMPAYIGKETDVTAVDAVAQTATVTDSKGNEHTIALRPASLKDALAALGMKIEKMRELDAGQKELIRAMIRICETAPPDKLPRLFSYDDLVEDLFGFASKSPAVFALHNYFIDNPIALFHELSEYLIKSEMISLRRDGDVVQVLDMAGNALSAPISLAAEALDQVQKGPENPHYLLRAVQRQFFGAEDRKLTARINFAKRLAIETDSDSSVVAALIKEMIVNVRDFEKLMSELVREKISIDDLSGKIQVSYHAAGTNKTVYKVVFETKDGRALNIVIALKKETGDTGSGKITQTEIVDLEHTSSNVLKDLKAVPYFGFNFKSRDGREMYVEEFIEGKTVKEIIETGGMTRGLKKKILTTLLTVGIVLGNAYPKDVHEGNIIITKQGEIAVMIDIGNKRFAVTEALRDKNYPAAIEYIFLLMLHYMPEGQAADDVMIPETWVESMNNVEKYLNQRGTKAVRKKKTVDIVGQEIRQLLEETGFYLQDIFNNPQELEKIKKVLKNNPYLHSYFIRRDIPLEQKDRLIDSYLKRMRTAFAVLPEQSGPSAYLGEEDQEKINPQIKDIMEDPDGKDFYFIDSKVTRGKGVSYVEKPDKTLETGVQGNLAEAQQYEAKVIAAYDRIAKDHPGLKGYDVVIVRGADFSGHYAKNQQENAFKSKRVYIPLEILEIAKENPEWGDELLKDFIEHEYWESTGMSHDDVVKVLARRPGRAELHLKAKVAYKLKRARQAAAKGDKTNDAVYYEKALRLYCAALTAMNKLDVLNTPQKRDALAKLIRTIRGLRAGPELANQLSDLLKPENLSPDTFSNTVALLTMKLQSAAVITPAERVASAASAKVPQTGPPVYAGFLARWNIKEILKKYLSDERGSASLLDEWTRLTANQVWKNLAFVFLLNVSWGTLHQWSLGKSLVSSCFLVFFAPLLRNFAYETFLIFWQFTIFTIFKQHSRADSDFLPIPDAIFVMSVLAVISFMYASPIPVLIGLYMLYDKVTTMYVIVFDTCAKYLTPLVSRVGQACIASRRWFADEFQPKVIQRREESLYQLDTMLIVRPDIQQTQEEQDAKQFILSKPEIAVMIEPYQYLTMRYGYLRWKQLYDCAGKEAEMFIRNVLKVLGERFGKRWTAEHWGDVVDIFVSRRTMDTLVEMAHIHKTYTLGIRDPKWSGIFEMLKDTSFQDITRVIGGLDRCLGPDWIRAHWEEIIELCKRMRHDIESDSYVNLRNIWGLLGHEWVDQHWNDLISRKGLLKMLCILAKERGSSVKLVYDALLKLHNLAGEFGDDFFSDGHNFVQLMLDLDYRTENTGWPIELGKLAKAEGVSAALLFKGMSAVKQCIKGENIVTIGKEIIRMLKMAQQKGVRPELLVAGMTAVEHCFTVKNTATISEEVVELIKMAEGKGVSPELLFAGLTSIYHCVTEKNIVPVGTALISIEALKLADTKIVQYCHSKKARAVLEMLVKQGIDFGMERNLSALTELMMLPLEWDTDDLKGLIRRMTSDNFAESVSSYAKTRRFVDEVCKSHQELVPGLVFRLVMQLQDKGIDLVNNAAHMAAFIELAGVYKEVAEDIEFLARVTPDNFSGAVPAYAKIRRFIYDACGFREERSPPIITRLVNQFMSKGIDLIANAANAAAFIELLEVYKDTDESKTILGRVTPDTFIKIVSRYRELTQGGFPFLSGLLNSDLSARELQALQKKIENGDVPFVESDETHLALQYLTLLKDDITLTFKEYRQYVDKVRKGEYFGPLYNKPQMREHVRGVVWEAFLMYKRILEIRETGQQVLVLQNLSYGDVATAPFTEDRNGKPFVLGTDIPVFASKIGSTEHHYDDPADRHFSQDSYDYNKVVSDDLLEYILRNNPALLIVDGSTSVVDTHRSMPHMPDSYKGWRNIALTINYAITGQITSLDPAGDDVALFQRVIKKNSSLQKLKGRVEELMVKIGRNKVKPMRLLFDYPGDEMLYLRRDHSKQKVIANKLSINDLQVGMPAMIIYQAIADNTMRVRMAPAWLKSKFMHSPERIERFISGFFDDKKYFNEEGRYHHLKGKGIVKSNEYADYAREAFRELCEAEGVKLPGAPARKTKTVIMPIDTLCLDFDGTIAKTDQVVSGEMLRVIIDLLKKGSHIVINTEDIAANMDGRLVDFIPKGLRKNLTIFSDGGTFGFGFNEQGERVTLDEYNERSRLAENQKNQIEEILRGASFNGRFEYDRRTNRISPDYRIDLRNINDRDRPAFIDNINMELRKAGIIGLKVYKTGGTSVKIVRQHKEDALKYFLAQKKLDEAKTVIVGDSARTDQVDRGLLEAFARARRYNVGKPAKTIDSGVVQTGGGIDKTLSILEVIAQKGGVEDLQEAAKKAIATGADVAEEAAEYAGKNAGFVDGKKGEAKKYRDALQGGDIDPKKLEKGEIAFTSAEGKKVVFTADPSLTGDEHVKPDGEITENPDILRLKISERSRQALVNLLRSKMEIDKEFALRVIRGLAVHEYADNYLFDDVRGAQGNLISHALASRVERELYGTAMNCVNIFLMTAKDADGKYLMKDDQLRAIDYNHPNDPDHEVYNAGLKYLAGRAGETAKKDPGKAIADYRIILEKLKQIGEGAHAGKIDRILKLLEPSARSPAEVCAILAEQVRFVGPAAGLSSQDGILGRQRDDVSARVRVYGEERVMPDEKMLQAIYSAVRETHAQWNKAVSNNCPALSRIFGRIVAEKLNKNVKIHIIGIESLSGRRDDIYYANGWKRPVLWGNHYIALIEIEGRCIAVDTTAPDFIKGHTDAVLLMAQSKSEMLRILSAYYGGEKWDIADSFMEDEQRGFKIRYYGRGKKSYVRNYDLQESLMTYDVMRDVEGNHGKELVALQDMPSAELIWEKLPAELKDWIKSSAKNFTRDSDIETTYGDFIVGHYGVLAAYFGEGIAKELLKEQCRLSDAQISAIAQHRDLAAVGIGAAPVEVAMTGQPLDSAAKKKIATGADAQEEVNALLKADPGLIDRIMQDESYKKVAEALGTGEVKDLKITDARITFTMGGKSFEIVVDNTVTDTDFAHGEAAGDTVTIKVRADVRKKIVEAGNAADIIKTLGLHEYVENVVVYNQLIAMGKTPEEARALAHALTSRVELKLYGTAMNALNLFIMSDPDLMSSEQLRQIGFDHEGDPDHEVFFAAQAILRNRGENPADAESKDTRAIRSALAKMDSPVGSKERAVRDLLLSLIKKGDIQAIEKINRLFRNLPLDAGKTRMEVLIDKLKEHPANVLSLVSLKELGAMAEAQTGALKEAVDETREYEKSEKAVFQEIFGVDPANPAEVEAAQKESLAFANAKKGQTGIIYDINSLIQRVSILETDAERQQVYDAEVQKLMHAQANGLPVEFYIADEDMKHALYPKIFDILQNRLGVKDENVVKGSGKELAENVLQRIKDRGWDKQKPTLVISATNLDYFSDLIGMIGMMLVSGNDGKMRLLDESQLKVLERMEMGAIAEQIRNKELKLLDILDIGTGTIDERQEAYNTLGFAA